MNRPKEGDRQDREIFTEQELRNIYYDPSEGYQSAKRLYQRAKEQSLNVSRKTVKDWLKTQATYTRYKSIVRKQKYQKTFVKNLADRMQLDLVDMAKYGNKNKSSNTPHSGVQRMPTSDVIIGTGGGPQGDAG